MQLKSCTPYDKDTFKPGKEIHVEVGCYMKKNKQLVMYPNGGFDFAAIVPRNPNSTTLAHAPSLVFFVEAPLLVELGFMMSEADTAAKKPNPAYSRKGRNLPMGNVHALKTEGLPGFYHLNPLTKAHNMTQGSTTTAIIGQAWK